MKNKLIVLGLVAVLATGTLAPSFAGRAGAAVRTAPVAAHVHSNPAFLEKTRFLAHMGFGFWAFHHFVIAPYQQHAFSAGSPHRITAFVKAGVATLFAYHEVKVSIDLANKSNSATLHALVAPLNALGAQMSALGNKFHGGQGSEQDVYGLNSSVNSFSQTAHTNGVNITDIQPPVGEGLAA